MNVSANRRDRQVGSSLVVQSFCWLPLVVVGWVGCLVFLDCCWLDWLYGFPWLLLVGLVAWFSVTVMAGLVVYIRLSFARLVGRFS